MSIFLDKENEKIIQEEEEESNEENKFISYYNKLFPNVEPLALYKNTKFVTIDKINGGLLTNDEIKEFKDKPTGYCFNLKDSNYFVIDVDMDDRFKARTNIDWEDECKLFNYNSDIPNTIDVVEPSLSDINKKKKLRLSNNANIMFCLLFNTPFVKTASKGYHFYFINDLTDEQIKDIFGISKSKYIKCITLFNSIDIDIFIDNKKDNDARLVLPFTKVVIENKEALVDINAYKTTTVEYSGLRYYKSSSFNKASTLIKWLKEHVDPLKVKEIKENNFDINKYNERGKVIDVFESDKENYIKLLTKDFKIIAKNMNEITTYKTYPFNLYTLMCIIAYFPINMHYDLLVAMIRQLSGIMSDNCIKQFLNYYYQIVTDEHHKEFWKGPSYLEAIINSKFNQSLENKYRFIHENDNNNKNDSSEEVIEDDSFDVEDIVKKINTTYPKFPLPSKFK